MKVVLWGTRMGTPLVERKDSSRVDKMVLSWGG